MNIDQTVTASFVRNLQKINDRVQRRLSHQGAHGVTLRSRGAQQMIVIVAGAREYLWSVVMPRLRRFQPDDADVCLVSPGGFNERLATLAVQYDWSYLQTRADRTALALNLAIESHPAARWIHKIDDDVVIADGYFQTLRDALERARRDGPFEPGIVSPMLNVNGYSYIPFLKALGIEETYRLRFGELDSAHAGVKAVTDGEAAQWLWEQSLPFDVIARRLLGRTWDYSTCPHRFSTSAFLIERSFWETLGGFSSPVSSDVRGSEEEQLCTRCMDLSRVMLVAHNVLAGHFAYEGQEEAMRAAWAEIAPQITLDAHRAPAAERPSEVASAA